MCNSNRTITFIPIAITISGSQVMIRFAVRQVHWPANNKQVYHNLPNIVKFSRHKIFYIVNNCTV